MSTPPWALSPVNHFSSPPRKRYVKISDRVNFPTALHYFRSILMFWGLADCNWWCNLWYFKIDRHEDWRKKLLWYHYLEYMIFPGFDSGHASLTFQWLVGILWLAFKFCRKSSWENHTFNKRCMKLTGQPLVSKVKYLCFSWDVPCCLILSYLHDVYILHACCFKHLTHKLNGYILVCRGTHDTRFELLFADILIKLHESWLRRNCILYP